MLSEIKVKEGETVPINTVVGVIDETAAKPASGPAKPAASAPAPAPAHCGASPRHLPHPLYQSPHRRGTATRRGVSVPMRPSFRRTRLRAASAQRFGGQARRTERTRRIRLRGDPRPAATARQAPAPTAPGLARPWSAAEARELRLSPVVRKIAREHHVDVRNIAGSGAGGRVTKSDILAYLDAGSPVARLRASAQGATADKPAAPLLAPNPSATAGLDAGKYERTPMSVMRRKIAEHMVMSKRTSAHVHSAFEIDFTKVDEIRKAKKAEYEKAGGKLTYMSFITKACAEALKKVPIVNASVDGTDIILQEGHQHRRRGRARLGPDRAGREERRHDEPPRDQQGDRRRGGTGAREEAEA